MQCNLQNQKYDRNEGDMDDLEIKGDSEETSGRKKIWASVMEQSICRDHRSR